MTAASYSDVLAQFRAALIARDIVPPDTIVADGRLHRCNAAGARGRGDAAYLLHLDGVPAGGMENWRDGRGWQTWRLDLGRPLTAAERDALRVRSQAADSQRRAEKARRHAFARERAERIWSKALPAPADHPYLATKQVAGHGVRAYRGTLIVPVHDVTGVLHGLQFIASAGAKRFLKDTAVQGHYLQIGDTGDSGEALERICIAEGFATGASVHAATGYPVAVAFHAGNLASVALAIRGKHPRADIVVCADDDSNTPGNPGRTLARQAALAVGGRLAFPDFGPARPEDASDFNDLHRNEEFAWYFPIPPQEEQILKVKRNLGILA